jgi:DNA-binding MarR family transcriptional regulator
MRHTWSKASEAQPYGGRTALDPQLNQLLAWIQSELPTNYRTTARKILMLARQAGKLELQVSCRTLADLRGINYKTASIHLRKLEELGFLRRTRFAVYSEAACYQIQKPSLMPHTKNAPARMEVCVALEKVLNRYSSRDSFAYTRTQEEAWITLALHGGMRPVELAKALGIRAAYNPLKKLLRAGLVEKQGSRYFAVVSDQAMDNAASLKRTLGRHLRRVAEHRQQRIGYRDWLVQRGLRFSKQTGLAQHRASGPSGPNRFSEGAKPLRRRRLESPESSHLEKQFVSQRE